MRIHLQKVIRQICLLPEKKTRIFISSRIFEIVNILISYSTFILKTYFIIVLHTLLRDVRLVLQLINTVSI